jgi:hypothetical protein
VEFLRGGVDERAAAPDRTGLLLPRNANSCLFSEGFPISFAFFARGTARCSCAYIERDRGRGIFGIVVGDRWACVVVVPGSRSGLPAVRTCSLLFRLHRARPGPSSSSRRPSGPHMPVSAVHGRLLRFVFCRGKKPTGGTTSKLKMELWRAHSRSFKTREHA